MSEWRLEAVRSAASVVSVRQCATDQLSLSSFHCRRYVSAICAVCAEGAVLDECCDEAALPDGGAPAAAVTGRATEVAAASEALAASARFLFLPAGCAAPLRGAVCSVAAVSVVAAAAAAAAASFSRLLRCWYSWRWLAFVIDSQCRNAVQLAHDAPCKRQ